MHPKNATMAARAPGLRSDAVRNRERILDAATELFAAQGLRGNINEVARLAGVGIGTLYRHFPNKEALVDELVGELLFDLLQEARDALDEPDGGGLRRFLFAMGELQASRCGCLPRLWNTAHHAELMAAIRATAAELLVDAQRHGQVPDELTPADVYAIMWSLRGLIETTRDLAPSMWRRHLEIILRGLSATAEPLAHKPAPKAAVDRVISALTSQA